MPSPEKAKTLIEERRKLLLDLTEDGDWVKSPKGNYRKKSFWRKVAVALHVSLEKREEWSEKSESGVVTYFFTYRASLPGGQFIDATGACSSVESGKSQARSLHDTRATAETRAKNRAISDLVAFGEVSAEEMNFSPSEETAQTETTQNEKKKPKLNPAQKEESYRILSLLAQVLPGTAGNMIEEGIHESKTPAEIESMVRKVIIHEMNEVHGQGLMSVEKMKKIAKEKFGAESFEGMKLKETVELLKEIENRLAP